MSLSPFVRSFAPELRHAFRVLDDPFFQPSGLRDAMNLVSVEGSSRPVLDVHEDANQYTIEVEVPGVKKNEIKVEFAEGGKVLVVSGQVNRTIQPGTEAATTESDPSTEVSTKDGNTEVGPRSTTWLSERYTGSFARSVRFPQSVDVEHVKAKFTDGILTLTAPKLLKEATRQTINIE